MNSSIPRWYAPEHGCAAIKHCHPCRRTCRWGTANMTTKETPSQPCPSIATPLKWLGLTEGSKVGKDRNCLGAALVSTTKHRWFFFFSAQHRFWAGICGFERPQIPAQNLRPKPRICGPDSAVRKNKKFLWKPYKIALHIKNTMKKSYFFWNPSVCRPQTFF